MPWALKKPTARRRKATTESVRLAYVEVLDVGQARAVVDGDVDELPTDPARPGRAVAVDAVAFAPDAPELLDVDVDQLPRSRALEAVVRLLGVEPGQARAPGAGQHFDAQAAEVCGLYVDPPANAIVVSVDEKTSIAARAPARPDPLPRPGRPARRDSEHLRNGTQNLFAALQVHSGEVSGMTAPTRNQWDFIAFLDQLEAEIPAGQQVIAVLDNLSTHKTQSVQTWLDEHPRWRLVFTPKHASWLNQVEMFFSILARRLLRHGQFSDRDDLAVQMLAFVEHYNLTAKPFTWTYTGKVLAA